MMGGVALAKVATGAKIAGGLFSAVSGYQSAKAEQEHAKINAYIGRTRAIQTDTAARTGLNQELADVRSVLAANQQGAGVGVFEMLDQIREERGRARRIEFGNRMQEVGDWNRRAAGAGVAARGALIGGIARTVPSMFDMYELYRNG